MTLVIFLYYYWNEVYNIWEILFQGILPFFHFSSNRENNLQFLLTGEFFHISFIILSIIFLNFISANIDGTYFLLFFKSKICTSFNFSFRVMGLCLHRWVSIYFVLYNEDYNIPKLFQHFVRPPFLYVRFYGER